MQAALLIPTPDGGTQHFDLRPEIVEGKPVLLSSHGHVINGNYFQLLRDRMGASIETNDLPRVSQLLSLPGNEPGLVSCEPQHAAGVRFAR